MKQEQQRVLAGSLNLLTPNDKTPENDAIELLNFRVDQAGVLRVADSFLELVPSAGTLGELVLGGAIHTLVKLSDLGSTIYEGGAGFLDLVVPANSFLIGAGTNLWFFSPTTLLLLAHGFDGQPLSIVVWNGFIWVMNQGRQLKINPPALLGYPAGPVVGSWLPAAPSDAPVATPETNFDTYDGPSGTYQYYVTFVSDAGLETNPSPASAAVTVTTSAVSGVVGATYIGYAISVASIAVSSDPTTAARRLYRNGGTLGATYQVAQLNDNNTTTYIDTQNDLALTELGIMAPGSDPTVGTNDPPPAAAGVIGPYLNFLLAWDGLYYGNRLYWSQNGVPLFPGSGINESVGNWVNVGAPDDHILGITIHTRMAMIYKQRSIWRLIGDPVTGTLEQCSATIGAAGARAIANAGAVDYIVSTDGLFLFDLDLEHKQSQKLDPVFFRVPQWTSLGDPTLPVHTWNPVAPVCAWLNGTVLLSDGSGTAFLFHAETQRFAAFSSTLGAAITTVCTIGSAFEYFIGDAAGNLGAAVQTTAVSQTAIWQTRFLDQGLGDQPKSYAALVLDAELNGGGAFVYVLYGGIEGIDATVDSWTPDTNVPTRELVGSFTGVGRQKYYAALISNELDIPPSAPSISVRVQLNCAGNGVPPAIHGLYIYYNTEARDTTALQTQPFPLDPQRGVWQVKEIEYDALARANVSAQVFSDLPGSGVAVRQLDILSPGNLEGNTVRRNYQFPQNQNGTGWWTGRLFQLSLVSSETFRLYGARLLARQVGTYIEDYEAQNGFVWDSWFLNFGSVQVKVFDQVKLEIETAAAFTVTLTTELPGEAPAVMATQKFTGNGLRKWYTLELPVDTIGRDMRVQIAAAGTWIFYSGKISLRVTGRYLSATQGDQLRTLEQDFGSERIKLCKKLEVDVNGTLTINVWTDEPGGLAQRFTTTLNTNGVRRTVWVKLPPNVRGRLWRIDATTTDTARVYAIRGWMRVVGEAGAVNWAWQDFALEPSETLPRWVDLPVAPTSETWSWVPVPLADPLDSSPVPTAMLPYAG